MADLDEASVFEAGIYRLEKSDPVYAGLGGLSNRQANQLANRTQWLKEQIAQIESALGLVAENANKLDGLDSTQFLRSDVAAVKQGDLAINGRLSINGNEAIDSNNLLTTLLAVDGANSQVDADFIRGMPGDFSCDMGQYGYQKLPSGLILQWGQSTGSGAKGAVTLLFPIEFPNKCLHASVSESHGHMSAYLSVVSYDWTNGSVSAVALSTTQSSPWSYWTPAFFAIGY